MVLQDNVNDAGWGIGLQMKQHGSVHAIENKNKMMEKRVSMAAERKYELQDLRKDMRVKVSQLSNIRDTCMILLDTELLSDNDVEGTLVYFGSGGTEEYTGWFQQEKAITPVYFDSEELEDGVVYDE